MTSGPEPPHPVEPAETVAALARALAGGPAVAPLPQDLTERRLCLAMLAPTEPVREPDAAAIVATSGSTGRPRGVVLSGTAIRASVAATHDRLGGPGDWLLALPVHYVAGLMVCARAIVAGTRLVGVARDLSDLPAPTDRRRYLSVVATQLARAVGQPQVARRLADLDAVLVGGGPVDGQLLSRAADVGIRVVTTYGMSETCGGCVYDGVPLAGVGVHVEPPDVTGDGSGRIRISGPTLFSGYRLRPDLTAAALHPDAAGADTLLTDDRGVWRAGRLAVLGRVDDVVVIGGRKVDLARVERLARTWADETAVLAVPHPEWGATLVAVTSSTGSDIELQAHLAPQLPTYALPRRLVRVPELPRTSTGKVDRQRLLADLTRTAR